MSWVANVGIEEETHEGYPVAVLSDLSEPEPVRVPVTRDGTRGLTDPDTTWWLYDGEHGPQAFAVRAGCSCGWRSKELFPLNFEDRSKTEGTSDDTGPYLAWQRQHIAHLVGATVPAHVRKEIEHLRAVLADLARTRPLAAAAAADHVEKMGRSCLQLAVPAATDNGHTWSEIGDALGKSRQAVWERFAKKPYRGTPPPAPPRPRHGWVEGDAPSAFDLPPVTPGWADGDDAPRVLLEADGAPSDVEGAPSVAPGDPGRTPGTDGAGR
ncbi:hypothetical protein [Streptomyces qinglanensis]|uniref:hypothetical protein n=1 Tax=Streptomyces qinglanensis TaxID=943816 RepID=UPI003D75B803